MPAPTLLVFDLDGTLIDSRLDLAHSVNRIVASLGHATLSIETVISFVGDGADNLLLKSLVAAGVNADEARENLSHTLKFFLDDYLEHCLDHTVPYPGVMENLDRFAQHKQAILTNKPMAHTVKILEGLGIRGRFGALVGGDGPLPKKPDPAGMAYILSALEATADETVLIGDSMQDLLTAQAANCRFVAYLNGLGDRKAIEAARPDFSMEHWVEFPGLMARMGSEK